MDKISIVQFWIGTGRCGLNKALKTMKVFTVLMLIASGSVHAVSMAQTVNLRAEKMGIEQFFSEIRRQTSYRFIYEEDVIKQNWTISVQAEGAALGDVLDEALSPLPVDYQIYNGSIMLTRSAKKKPVASAGKRQEVIQGLVVDEFGKGLAGVSIRIKNKTTGDAATADDGRFRISASIGDSLVFSYLGYTTRTIAAAGVTMNVSLQPAESANLEEVVVVGYGRQKKSEVTASISSVNQETIRQTPGATLQNMLTGKVSGFFTQQRSGRPGGDAAEMTIRGVATYNGGVSPLILVDDIEYNLGQFHLISIDEVESISILKDAEATAIYGVKGANGVVLVTTKRGQRGKPSINIRSEAGLQIPIRTFQTLGAYDAALLTNEALRNDGLDPLFSDESIDLFRTGADPYGHPSVDWYNTIFRSSAPMTETNLNFSGGTDRARYFLSMGYQDQSGLLNDIEYRGREPEPNTSDVNNNYYSKRYKFRSNIDVDPTPSLKVSLDLAGTYHEVNQPAPAVFRQIFHYDFVRPYGYPVYNPDGSFGYPSPHLYEPWDRFNNPAALVSLGGYNRTFNNFMNAGLAVTQKLDALVPGLSAKAMATYSYANTANRSQNRNGIPSYYYNPDDGSYTPRDQNIFRIAPYEMSYGGGVPNNRMNLQAHLTYSARFAAAHNVNALLLFNQTSYYEGAGIPANFRGYTYRFGYNYKERYVFSASGAYNGSDRFITQRRFNLFPAFAVAWNAHNESFFEQAFPFIGSLKVRGSYGIVGNDNIGINQYFFEERYARDRFYAFGETPNGRTGIMESDLGNDDVSWESERKWNVGVDASMFNNRLTITADYFSNHRYDILTRRQTIPMFFGVQTGNLPFVNLGEVKNSGFEVDVSYNGQIGQVGYHLKGMATFAKNKLVFRDDPPALYPWQDRTGLPLGTNRQYIWTGGFYTAEDVVNPEVPKPAGVVREGWLKYSDLNGDGIINVDDMAYTGRPNRPNTVLAFTLGASYKGFSISILLQSNLGSDVHGGYEQTVPFKAALQPLHLNRWTPETAATATFPALTSNFVSTYMNPNGNLSTFWTENANYIRLRSMELGYTFPQAFAKRLRLASLRVFANGYNLGTWSSFYKKYQYDPEVANNFNDYIYPVTSIVNFGVSVGL